MTDREKAIVMAHTGVCMLAGEKLCVFYQYLEELYNRPVYTHEGVTLNIKEKSKPDFLQLCKEETADVVEVRHGRWIHDGYDFPHGNDWIHCSVCGKRGINVPADLTNYCSNCGAKMDGE